MVRFDDVLEELDVAVVVQDAAARVLHANRAAAELLEVDGLRRAPFEAAWDCVGPDGAALPPDALPLARAVRTRGRVRDVVVGVAPPGRGRVWLSVSAAATLDAAGEVERVVVSWRDVSAERAARREAERVLEESGRLYRSVLRAMSEGVVVHGPDGTIEFANPSAERALGLTADQIAGRTPLDPRWRLVDEKEAPFDPARIPSEVTRVTGRPCSQVRLGVHRPDGELAWLSVNTDPVGFAPDGRPTAVVATLNDVTQEQRARRELERSRAQFKLVTDVFPGVLYEFRSSGGRYSFTFLSGRAEEYFGVPIGAALLDAQAVIDRIHPDDQATFVRSVEWSERTMTPWRFETRHPEPQGGWRWMRALSVPERVGEDVVWRGVVLDVTEERRLAESLRHRQRVDAMGELAAGVAHNFNNMLAVILPNLELALDGARSAERPRLEQARRATESAAELVRQLMRFTRKEPEVVSTPVDLGLVVRDVAALLTHTVERSIRIAVETPTIPVMVRGRAGDLSQIVLNLCLNARDALAGRSDARLDLTLALEAGALARGAATTDTGRHVALRVRDTGAGMDPATLARLGEPFFTTKAPGRGTGLGLATVFSIVSELDGAIEVDSEVGRGTTFVVRLPLERAPEQLAPARTALPTPLHGLRLLVIDDEPLVRDVLVRQLAAEGASAHAAEDGAKGLAAFEPARFDVVLLDLNMPGLPGARVLEELRRRAPRQLVVVMSGAVHDPAELALADAVLQKPAGRATIVETIARILGRTGR